MLAAATFAFTISLGEFGATLLISRPEYPTIPVAIERFLSQPGGLNYGQAMAMATILMILTIAQYFAHRKIPPAQGRTILMLEVHNIFKTYEGKPLLKDISFTVAERGDDLPARRIGERQVHAFADHRWTGISRTQAGLVQWTLTSLIHRLISGTLAWSFRTMRLFPHLNVFDNVAFGLKMRQLALDEIQSRVASSARTW